MITQEQIPTVLDHPVYDTGGNKIGDAKHVFLEDATGQPEWVSVKTGLFGTSESFVPIHDASVVEDHLEVPYPRDTVKDAPNVDAGGHLSEDEERRLHEHYGIDWDAAWQQANQPGEGGWAHTDTSETTDMPRSADTGAGGDDAMTRSEERMHVGTERREEVRVERVPITDETREAALSGPDISHAEHEVTLHEERPVTETETVPVERVRMTTEEQTTEETVRGQVRKEEIDTEGVDEDRRDK
ncbi:PRC and DUF2382 domain-containing protein [Streptomyces paradoxus]|uniref:Stress response protein YsnF n=1 Tax=Streptomyces paradoxus TaxID=66375 RepID=A0A7W9TJN3_9ACTN|nr:DUF2382 domain-containing protein [Streptomyces paradoxus]MBB6081869.1 stress response protein YsnF [Streptomyces paradoxus]